MARLQENGPASKWPGSDDQNGPASRQYCYHRVDVAYVVCLLDKDHMGGHEWVPIEVYDRILKLLRNAADV